jgi:hypothetical protein
LLTPALVHAANETSVIRLRQIGGNTMPQSPSDMAKLRRIGVRKPLHVWSGDQLLYQLEDRAAAHGYTIRYEGTAEAAPEHVITLKGGLHISPHSPEDAAKLRSLGIAPFNLLSDDSLLTYIYRDIEGSGFRVRFHEPSAVAPERPAAPPRGAPPIALTVKPAVAPVKPAMAPVKLARAPRDVELVVTVSAPTQLPAGARRLDSNVHIPIAAVTEVGGTFHDAWITTRDGVTLQARYPVLLKGKVARSLHEGTFGAERLAAEVDHIIAPGAAPLTDR